MTDWLTFGDWLAATLESRDMKQADLVRIAHIDSGLLSRILSGERRPSARMCNAIARALNLPAQEVFERASLLPPSADKTPRAERAAYLFDNLTAQEQLTMLDVMEGMIGNRIRRNKHGAKGVVDETRAQSEGY